MNARLRAVIMALLASGSILAIACSLRAEPSRQSQSSAPSGKPAEARAVLVERKLPPDIAQQHQRVQSLMTPFAKGTIKKLVPEYLNNLKLSPPNTDVRRLAYSQVHHAFPRATRQQSAVLTFDLLAQSCDSSSISDMSAKMQLELQMSQQQYDQAMQAVSNMMKSMSGTSDSVISNIK